MKKILLVALLVVMGFASQAKALIQINPIFPNPCSGTITITFLAYDHGTCAPVATAIPITITSPGAPFTVDLDDPATWGGPIPSYLCFGVQICMDCTPITPFLTCMTVGDFCCFPQTANMTPPCCPAGLLMNARWTTGGSGGIAYSLDIY